MAHILIGGLSASGKNELTLSLRSESLRFQTLIIHQNCEWHREQPGEMVFKEEGPEYSASHCCDQLPAKRQLKREGLILAESQGAPAHNDRKVMAAGA